MIRDSAFILDSGVEHLDDGSDRIPVARCDGNSKECVDLIEVPDSFHVTPVHAEDESVFGRENF